MLKRNLIAVVVLSLGMISTANVFGQSNNGNSRIKAKSAKTTKAKRPAQPQFRPNPIGDGTTEQVRSTNTTKVQTMSGQSSKSSNARRKQTPKPNTGFMDYTDDNTDFIKADKTKSVNARDAASGQATGRRMKTITRNGITSDDDWEEPVKANKQNQRTTANSSPISGDITTKANRRKFDHIGNINGTADETTRNRKPKAEKFSGTILEGSNIKRKQPRRKGKGKN